MVHSRIKAALLALVAGLLRGAGGLRDDSNRSQVLQRCGACTAHGAEQGGGGQVTAVLPSNHRLRGLVRKAPREGQGDRKVASFWDVRYALARRWELATRVVEDGDHRQMPDRLMLKAMAGKVSKAMGLSQKSGRQRCSQWLPPLGHIGQEDCLVLDIYTPTVNQDGASLEAAARKPVLLFIHGGAYIVGDKYQNGLYDGYKLAATQDVVVVCVNYRLGPLGFLSHPNLPEANFGLHDQLLAMQWVQQNIAAFGGNPDKVTLFGESAGSMSVCAHLSSPHSRPYFKAAVMQSGNCDGPFAWETIEKSRDKGLRYIRSLFGRLRGCRAVDKVGTVLDPEVVASGFAGYGSHEAFSVNQDSCNGALKSMGELVDVCGGIWGIGPQYHKNNKMWIRRVLPFPGLNSCKEDYSACLVSDAKLLKCAQVLSANRVWVNRFGLQKGDFEAKSEYALLYYLSQLSVTGMDPEMPWKPAHSSDRSDFGSSGLLRLPLTEMIHNPPFGKRILLGFNRDEGSLFVPGVTLFAQGAKDAVSRQQFGVEAASDSQRAVVEYFLCGHVDNRTTPCSADMFIGRPAYNGHAHVMRQLITDYLFACPQLRAAGALADATPGPGADAAEVVADVPERVIGAISPMADALIAVAGQGEPPEVFVYFLEADDFLPKALKDSLGSFHMADLLYIFGLGNLALATTLLSWSEADRQISLSMQSAIAQLADGGPLLGDWRPWQSSERGVVRRFAVDTRTDQQHSRDVELAEMGLEHDCGFWQEFRRLQTKRM